MATTAALRVASAIITTFVRVMAVPGVLLAFVIDTPVCTAENPFHRQVIDGIAFDVANGYTLEKIAGQPQISRPTVACWDDQRRLVVCESAGVHEKTSEQLVSKPHKLVRLSDLDGDGQFENRIVAAEGLSFYSGVLVIGQDAYVSTPPTIQKLSDLDDDGVYEKRQIWHDGGTITGCANDLHGPYLGRDGWIYWCKGAFAQQTHRLTDGTELVSKASHLLRRRIDGDRVEIAMSGGMDNPVEMAMLPNGEKLFSSTLMQHLAAGKRDGISHAVYGSLFGKPHHPIDGHFRTGELMPILIHLGAAAPSGLAYLNQWSEENPILACAEFNLHKVSVHELITDGASFRTISKDLVRSDYLPFHPTDVIEDADGSLIILDTGDWYDLCCPSSGAEDSTELGGVYRLSRTDFTPPGDALGERIRWDELSTEAKFRLLGDPRHVVRQKAAYAIDLSDPSCLAEAEKQVVRSDLDLRTSLEIVWLLTRSDHPNSAQLLTEILRLNADLGDRHALQTAVLNSLALIGPTDDVVIEQLLSNSPSGAVRRAAAECIGRHGSSSSVNVLMSALDWPGVDRTLEHSIIYALKDLNVPQVLEPYLDADSIRTRPLPANAALVVLRQTRPERLRPHNILLALTSQNEKLRNSALRTMVDNQAWSTNLAPEIAVLWGRDNSPRSDLSSIIAAWHNQPKISAWFPLALQSATVHEAVDLLASIKSESLPTAWDKAVADLAARCDARQRRSLLELLSSRVLTDEHSHLLDWLLSLCADEEQSDQDRLLAAASIPPSIDPASHQQSSFVVRNLLSGEEDKKRWASRAAQSLTLDQSSAQELLVNLDLIETTDLAAAVASIVRSSRANAVELLERLSVLPAARTLPHDFLAGLYNPFDASLKTRAKELAHALSKPPKEIGEALDRLEKELPPGDSVRGMAVFRSNKAACSACHRIGSVGGDVGPALMGIGNSRSRRDLIQAIVFPSSHIAQGYRSTRILTHEGQAISGIVRHETSEQIELFVALGKQLTVSKLDIERRQESDISLMPAGLEGVLSKQDLADVVEFLGTYRVRQRR